MKPRIFIGSSTEGLPIAQAIQQNLDHDAECTVWTQGVFGVSSYPIEALLDAVRQNDFSIFVFSPDDEITIRKDNFVAARDNVILESGLFIGRYGKDRNFVVAPRALADFHIPSDFLGITLAQYDPSRIPRNAQAALGAACTSILDKIKLSPVMTTQLTFSYAINRSDPGFPLQLVIDIRNDTNVPVLVTSKHFQTGKVIRPQTGAKGNPALGQYEIKFPTADGFRLSQFNVLIHPHQDAETWMPLDSTHTDAEVNSAIRSATCGQWHYSCDWLGSNGWHREYVQNM